MSDKINVGNGYGGDDVDDEDGCGAQKLVPRRHCQGHAIECYRLVLGIQDEHSWNFMYPKAFLRLAAAQFSAKLSIEP